MLLVETDKGRYQPQGALTKRNVLSTSDPKSAHARICSVTPIATRELNEPSNTGIIRNPDSSTATTSGASNGHAGLWRAVRLKMETFQMADGSVSFRFRGKVI